MDDALQLGDELANNVFGLFDRGAATDPPANRFYWRPLATPPQYATAVDSLDGKRVLVGTADTTIRTVYSADGAVVTHTLPADVPAKAIRPLSATPISGLRARRTSSRCRRG
jgi:hypothetical protein